AATVAPTVRARGTLSASYDLVKIIDVVRNHQRTHNFPMTMIRLSGSQLHAARVLVGLSREEVAARRAVPALNPQMGDVERRHFEGCIRTSAAWSTCSLSNGSGTPLPQSER